MIVIEINKKASELKFINYEKLFRDNGGKTTFNKVDIHSKNYAVGKANNAVVVAQFKNVNNY